MPAATTRGARTRARELLLQALYQRQIAGHTAEELLDQFHAQAAYARIDQQYFDAALPAIVAAEAALGARIARYADRPVAQLDPVELAILSIGTFELAERGDVPYRVVIDECINLARRFGASDGHKYINACLDAAARDLRSAELEAKQSG
ncbi:MAG: transcription antitermination factor NusB [Woeseiaceae bacterium]|nr:transcription antitermination factor NusB [Woeseiaceae bacterium]